MTDTDIDLDDIERRMEGALASLKSDFGSLRTGRASASMLDAVTVDAYGTAMPVNQLGHHKRARAADGHRERLGQVDGRQGGEGDPLLRAGLNPVVEGTLLRLPIPELNEERRRDFTKVAGKYAEHARVAIRNVRRDGMDKIKRPRARACRRMNRNFTTTRYRS